MHFLNSILVLTLALGGLAARSPNVSLYEKYSSAQGSSSTIELDAAAYDELTTPSRNYSLAVLLTALDKKYKCNICQEFQPEWDLIARSWKKGDKKGETRTLFATIDFDKEKTIFQRVSTSDSV